VDRKLGLLVAGLAVVCGMIALGAGGCSGAQGGATPGDNLTPGTPSDTGSTGNDSARHSVTFTLNLANDGDAQASARGLLPRAGVEYPYDEAEMDLISIVKEGVRLGNDCVGDDGSHRTFNVFLVNETGDAMQGIQVEIVSCEGATADETLYDYGTLADGEGGPGPAWDEVDGNEQVWSFSYTGTLSLTATVEVSWGVQVPVVQKVAWVSPRDGNYEIYVGNADGSGTPVNVSKDASFDYSPSLSADGTKVAWLSYREGGNWEIGNYEIYVGNADGSGTPVNVSKDAGIDDSASLSADGTRVAWYRHRDDNVEIYVGNADGSGTPVNVSHDGWKDEDPSLSADGTRVAWWSDRDRTGLESEIYVGNADGSGTPVNVSKDDGCRDYQPSLSADGTRVAWTGERDGNYEIYVGNADGSGTPVNVSGADDAVSGENASLSADGTRVAWTSYKRAGIHGAEIAEIYVGNADGSGTPVNVFKDDGGLDFYPSLSADGTRVAWMSNRDGNWEIYVGNADGSGTPVNVSNDPWYPDTYPSLQGN